MNTNNIIQFTPNTMKAVKVTENGHRLDKEVDLSDTIDSSFIQAMRERELMLPDIDEKFKEVYGDTDYAFQEMLDLLAIDHEYFEVMNKNEDLHIIFGYILTILRSAMAKSCDLDDDVSSHLDDIVATVKENMVQ